MLNSLLGRLGRTSRHSLDSRSRRGRRLRGVFESLESRQLLSITLPSISDVTLKAGTTVYVPLSGADSGHTVNYSVVASDYANLTTVMMPASNKTLRLTVDVNGTEKTMDFQLFDNLSPTTTAAIEQWVNAGYYDGLEIYRNYWLDSSTPALIQGGNEDPDTGPIKTSKDDIGEEFNPNLQYTTAGMLGMARTSTVGTSSSEFFITESGSDAMRSFLDYEYTIFGVQTSGSDVVSTIADMPNKSTTSSYLETPVTIVSAEIITDNQGGVLQISAPTDGTGTVTVTVTAYDDTGSSTPQEFTVTLAADSSSNPTNPFASVIPTTPTSLTYVPGTIQTNVNKSLEFEVSGVTSGNLVEILCDGNVIGQATANGTTVTVTTDSSTTIADGNHTFTAIQIAPDQTVSMTESGTTISETADVPGFNSSSWQLTIDTAPPVFSYPTGNEAAVVGVLYQCHVVTTDTATTTYDLSSSPTGMTIDADTGAIRWTPASTQTGKNSVIVVATDAAGNTAQKQYSITVSASNTAPVLTPATPSLGKTVDYESIAIPLSQFIAGGSGTTGVTDADSGAALGGIALVGMTGTGQWEYSVNSSTFVAIGTVSESSALLLSGIAQLRYTPNGTGAETATITYRAWDATSGGTGGRVDLSVDGSTGGSTSCSTKTDTASLTVVSGPTVTVDWANGQASPTSASLINFKVVFSKSVTGFDNSDVKVTGTAITGAAGVVVTNPTGDGVTFNVAISGMSRTGTVILNIPAGAATDADGYNNKASTTTDDHNIVTYDITGPTVTIEQASDQDDPTSSSPIHFTVTFSESVSDFDASDVALQFLNYSVTDLGTLGGTESTAYAINNAGQIVGYSTLIDSTNGSTHAFLYSGGKIIDLGTFTNNDGSVYLDTYAYGINDQGQIVGYASSSDGSTHAFLFDGSSMIDLGTVVDSSYSQARSINDDGKVVGFYYQADNSVYNAFLYSNGTLGKISELGSSTSYAYAINSGGTIVGEAAFNSTTTDHAFLSSGTKTVDLSTLGGTQSTAYAVNDNGDVVGVSTLDGDSEWHAFVYHSSDTSAEMVDLGDLNGLATIATAINNKGAIVGSAGSSTGSDSRAFLYVGGTMIDLKTLLNSSGMGWQLLEALDINDSGQIVGIGVNPAGETHAFLLNPVASAAGTPVVTVTATGTDGTTYDVAVSGFKGQGQLIATIPAGAAHDKLNDPSNASTSTDNSVIYDFVGPVVTINKATTQIDPTSSSTIHFSVVFNESVSDFTADDVKLSGTAVTAWDKLTATVTGSGTTYDVAVVGMTRTGTVIATIAAGTAHDSLDNANSASTSTDNSVQFVMATPPTFRMTAPSGTSAQTGQTVVIAWYATNVVANTKISLCYDKDTVINGNETWITINSVSAANGYGTYKWNTTGIAPGTYYVAGYLWSGKAIFSHLTASCKIVAPPSPTFRVTAPTSGTYTVGQSVTVYWLISNASPSYTVNLCYDTDKVWNGNEKWLPIKKTATNGYGSYAWNTAELSAGTYYIGGYLDVNGKHISSHLVQSITITAPKPSFRVTAPSSGTYTAGQDINVYYWGANVPTNGKVSLCYDKDTIWNNGNEKWIEINHATAVNGYGHYTWNTLGVAPGKYYLAGYLWAYGKATFSHLTQAITIAASRALTVDASATRVSDSEQLTDGDIQPIVLEAERRLAAATGIQVASAMSNVSVRIVDLPGNTLGEAAGNVIYIDRDAAGYGWFVDSTPDDDGEFSDLLGSNTLVARTQTAAANRVDLLTTVMHEMAHILGAEHSNSLDLMSPTLLPGERRILDEQSLLPLLAQSRALSSSNAVDRLFASVSGDNKNWVLK
jgi:probable HAF family extracellular repeat protein